MKVIDSHLHFCPNNTYFDEIARNAGHQNTEVHLKKVYESLGIAGGVVMGNRSLALEKHRYPSFLRYCVGIEGPSMEHHQLRCTCDLVELHLQRPDCVGVKLYPGYSPIYVSDRRYEPIYELAAAYKKPVAIHMGQTASSHSFLKYSHPLTLDETAVLHPNVQFVMCHFGNPWLMDAAAVIEKNSNVAADLSGLLVGKLVMNEFLSVQKGYLDALKTWISYIHDYGKLMFGTDWPLANYPDYIEITKKLIPEKHWEEVFSGNASRIYSLQDVF